MRAARDEGWRTTGTDLSHEACAIAATAGPVVQADARALPFAGATFDALTLVNVLDHTIHPLRVVREAARVLRPGGLLVVRIPNAAFHAPWAPLLAHLGPLVRWRGWDAYPILHLFALSPGAVRRLVERAGFDVVTLRNSTLAAAAPDAAATRRGNAGRRILRRLTAALAGTARAVTAGRWLVGPSIEVYARRRGGAARVIGVDHVITRLTMGGSSENTVLTIADLERAGYASTLVLGPESEPPVVDDARRRGCRIVEVATLGREVHPLRDLAAVGRLCGGASAARAPASCTRTRRRRASSVVWPRGWPACR